MLKFVSRKPPKGKAGNLHYTEYQEPQALKAHQTRLFRSRVSPGMRSPPSFDPSKGDKSHIHMSGRDSLGYDATSGDQTECVYDNLDKVRDRSKQIQENGQDISFDSSDLTRSRSPSNLSSESSPYGSLRKKYDKFQDPRRSGHGYRHVTWSPDVTNGDNLPMINEKYVSAPTANSHCQSPYNLATRTYMADDYVRRKPDLSHLRYTVGNVKDCIQTVPGPNVQGSGRTVNMSEQFRGDKRAITSDMYSSRNKPVQSKLITSTDSNISDPRLGPCQFPRDLDQSLGEPSSLTDSGPNYAYYTTLPANFSMRSNFVFSPRICSTPVKDLSKEKPRLKVIIPPKEKEFQLTNQHTFPSHVTNKCVSDGVTTEEGNDEYDNIAMDTDQKDYRKQPSDITRQEMFKSDNVSVTHQDVGKGKTQSTQSKTNYPGLFYSLQSQSEPHHKDQPVQQSPARHSDMIDQSQRQVRRGFPRLFLPKENSWKKPPVSGHPTTGTTTTAESMGFQEGDKRDRYYQHFDSLVRAPRIIPEAKKVETGPVVYQQIRKVGEGQDKGSYPGWSYTEQPPTHKHWEGQDKGGYSEGRFMEQPPSHKVMTSCVPQVNHEVKHEPVKKYQYSPREPPASGSNTPGTNMSTLRDMINRAQVEDDQLVLDLVYITERIISMSFPSDEHEVTYSYNLKEVMNMLRTKHDDNCLVINLSEPRQDLEKFNPKHVIDYGWPDYLAPPLERLCNICKAMDSWLSTDPRHVVVVHCKGSTSRIAVIIAAFMHYCSICASADQALDRFAMKRFYDDKLGGITLPSQIRYVEYFYGLLSGAIKINSNPLYLHHIVIHGVPNFDTQGGCRPFIKVYQGMQNIFTSGVYNVTDQMQKVCISISPGIPLRGDIMIKCYHKKAKTGQREVVWACQFHTCAISGYTLTFAKKDLDDARTDPRFPDTGKVEFVFGNSQDSNVRVTDFKSDVTVPVDDGSDALVRWDSYENFSNVKNADGTINDVNENSVTSSTREGATRSIRDHHSQGPVDGSLYATVTKRKHEHVETTSSSLFQNGTASHDQQNGSHTSSVDSGISASSSGIAGNTSSNMNTTSTSVNITPQYTSNVNNNDSLHQSFSSTLNSSKSSYNNGVSGGQKKTVPPLDEQTQLDMILSDLLNDSVFVSSPQSPPKSGANSVSKDTRTFRTYDTTSTPDGKTTYQTAEVTYKIPGGYKEERNYTMTKTEEKSYVPKNAFSYTSGPTSPELQRKAESPKTHSLPYRTDYENRYYSNNESSFNRTMDSSRSMSPNEQTSSWLQEQQQKLRQRKDSKDEKTVQQERQLVEELKTAQNKYFMKRAHNQAEEQATMDTYRSASSPPPVANGPVSSSYVVTQNHSYSTDRSAHEPARSFSPPGFTGETFYNSSYSSTSTSSTQKPPPSPGQQRAQPLTSPVVPPVRSSSKDFMQRSRNTSTSSWQGRIGQKEPEQEIKPAVIRAISVTTPPQSPRPFSPVQKQQTYQVSTSRTTVEQQHPQRDQSLDIQMTLPVHAPTKTKVTEVQEVSLPEGEKKSHYITEVYVHRTAGADGTGTQRSTIAEQKEKVEKERNKLEELEKSLQAASNSIIATTPWQQQQQQQQKSYSTTERHVTRRVETRKFETHQQQQHHQQQQSSQVQAIAPPPPKQISVVEEDKISLRPIGPGVQTLEPEGMGTMGRSGATTPSFPVSPVASAATPPFPVSPKTPYYNQAGSVTSPFNTMSSTTSQHHTTQQHQQQHVLHHQQPQQMHHQQQQQAIQQQQQQQFQQQQQQYQQQQQQHQQQQQQHTQHQQYQYQQEYHTGGRHQSGSMSSQDASHALHVDTSPRMISPGGSMARTPTSPPSPSSLNTLRQQLSVGGTMSPTSHSVTGQSSPSLYFGTSRRGSISSLAESEPAHITTPRFVKDMSKYWYKPQITREDAIMLLKDKQPGSFVVRDSNSYPGAFGLALKVAQIPPNVQTKSTGDPSADLVRHFLIEPTHKGVRLRGSNNEPIFGSLASLVYQHSNTPLSLPCKLVLPDAEAVAMEGSSTIDSSVKTELPSSAAALLAQGAACNVLFLNSVDTESLTGPQAVARAMKVTFDMQPTPKTTVVHFKVSNQGITLTDNQRKLFFRRHYPVAAVTYCGMDPDGRKWKRETETGALMEARVFGFVARKSGGHSDNACHLFAEVDPEQPASAIVNFVTKIMIGQSGKVKP